MSAQVEPIHESDLASVCNFLHTHFDTSVSVEQWRAAFHGRWVGNAPNSGFMLVHDDEIVGVIGAIYSDRNVEGSLRRYCNLTSWYVMPEHRASTLKMLLALLRQKNLHFTNFSPTDAAAEVLQRLKFRRLQDSVWVFPVLPLPGGPALLTDLDEIGMRLEGDAKRLFEDHRDCRRVEHIAVVSGSRICHIIFRRARFHGIPMAKILHLSDSSTFSHGTPSLGRHFLLHRGIPLVSIESRMLEKKPHFAILRAATMPKLVRSETLSDSHFGNAYTELMCFDI